MSNHGGHEHKAAGTSTAGMSRRCLLLAALVALPQVPRVHGQAPTWNDKTFDTAVDRRIATYDELREYGYQVAGPVGLMLLPLLGVESKAEVAAAREPAVALGVAIQIANILRDARPDAALGRVYLPQDELAAVGATDADIFAGRPTAAHREVVAKNAARARALLDDAEAGANAPGGWGYMGTQWLKIVENAYFTNFILFAILCSSIMLAMETPRFPAEGSRAEVVFFFIDVAFTAVFTVEPGSNAHALDLR